MFLLTNLFWSATGSPSIAPVLPSSPVLSSLTKPIFVPIPVPILPIPVPILLKKPGALLGSAGGAASSSAAYATAAKTRAKTNRNLMADMACSQWGGFRSMLHRRSDLQIERVRRGVCRDQCGRPDRHLACPEIGLSNRDPFLDQRQSCPSVPWTGFVSTEVSTDVNGQLRNYF